MENYLGSKNQTSSDLKAIKKHSSNTLKTQHEIASIESIRQLNTCQNPLFQEHQLKLMYLLMVRSLAHVSSNAVPCILTNFWTIFSLFTRSGKGSVLFFLLLLLSIDLFLKETFVLIKFVILPFQFIIIFSNLFFQEFFKSVNVMIT